MPIITLTTDLGTRDHYVAALKGTLIGACPEASLVDITHEILPQNIIDGAFVFRNAFTYFPAGTIHLLVIDPADQKATDLLYFYQDGHHFLMPDNGLASLVFDTIPEPVIRVDTYDFPLLVSYKEVMALACRNIIDGQTINGTRTSNIRAYTNLQPLIYPDSIKGAVVYTDTFHNAITNISRSLFEEQLKGRSFEISTGRNNFTQVYRTYGDVPPGEKVCIFNSSGLLEFAINEGKAASLLNLTRGTQVLINFRNLS